MMDCTSSRGIGKGGICVSGIPCVMFRMSSSSVPPCRQLPVVKSGARPPFALSPWQLPHFFWNNALPASAEVALGCWARSDVAQAIKTVSKEVTLIEEHSKELKTLSFRSLKVGLKRCAFYKDRGASAIVGKQQGRRLPYPQVTSRAARRRGGLGKQATGRRTVLHAASRRHVR